MTHIQHPDINASPATFKKMGLGEDELLTIKCFYTLQGEGPFGGAPAVFVRLAGCNRGKKEDCPWCDTFFQVSAGIKKSIGDILVECHDLWENNRTPEGIAVQHQPLIVLTGGEPMIQPITNLVGLAQENGWLVQIESNGDFLQDIHEDAVLVVSPKIAHNQKTYGRLKKEVLDRADFLKFVVSADPNSPYHNIPDYVFEWADREDNSISEVYVSPMTVYRRDIGRNEKASLWDDNMVDRAACQQNHNYAARLAMTCGFSLSLQTHLMIGVE